MPVDTFTKSEFEAALPVHRESGRPLWIHTGLVQGEHEYAVHVTDGDKPTNKLIRIRSSIGENGQSAESGADSIRLWIEYEYKGSYHPLKKHSTRWTTRVEGWQERMIAKLHELYKLALEDSRAFQRKNGNSSAQAQGAKPVDGSDGHLTEQAQAILATLKLQPRAKREFTPSKYQQAIFDFVQQGVGNAVVEAVAGSGKTTTLVKALEYTSPDDDVAFVAFNRHIAKELAERAPEHVHVSTLHSLGFSNIRAQNSRIKVEQRKLYYIVKDMQEQYGYEDAQAIYANNQTIQRLVSLCKATLQEPMPEVLEALCDRYGLETNGQAKLIYEVTAKAFTESERQCAYRIDYDDMIWLCASGRVPCEQFDVLFVDEAQDLNVSQIEMVLKSVRAGGRVVAVGDRHQCHPGNTTVALCPEAITGKVTHVPIWQVRPGDTVVSYNSKKSYFPGTRTQGRRVLETAHRAYYGSILQITASKFSTECTPNHRWLVRMSKASRSKYGLYLMTNKAGWARVGIVKMSVLAGSGLATRARQEKADRAWLLKVLSTKEEATAWEIATQAHFGLPGLVFENRGSQFIAPENIKLAYALFQTPHLERARQCIEWFGREWDYPLWDSTTPNSHVGSYSFITQACNLIEKDMEVRTFAGSCRGGEWHPISSITERIADGERVYSLKVEPVEGRNLYIANGLVVHNSIYGFRGADTSAIPNLIKALEATTLPLSITYRCPKSHVELAQSLVPHIEAAEWAIEGSIKWIAKYTFRERVQPGDAVLCRCNAPLVRPCFSLIRDGIKAVILGRDIGQNLMSLVRKVQKQARVTSLRDTLWEMQEYVRTEVDKLLDADKGTRAQLLEDKRDTILALSDGCRTVAELEQRIQDVFSDDKEGVVFSTVHKFKGGEAERVYILEPGLMPHPRATQEWEMVQEANLKYVSITRSKRELYFVE